MFQKPIAAVWVASALFWFGTAALAEVVYLHNGDILHGTVIGASERAITLQTAYGNLVVPKTDIRQIDYQGVDPAPSPEEAPAAPPRPDAPPQPSRPEGEDAPNRTSVTRDRPAAGQSAIALDVRGDSFWYAFAGSPDEPADVRIRLRLFVAGEEAVLLVDGKHDTEDGDTKYNSFTFAPEDTQVVATSEGYSCRLEVVENDEGRDGVLLLLGVPQASAEQRVLLRMLYQVNEGSLEFPRWTNVLSRSFPVPLEAGKETLLVLQQDASGGL